MIPGGRTSDQPLPAGEGLHEKQPWHIAIMRRSIPRFRGKTPKKSPLQRGGGWVFAAMGLAVGYPHCGEAGHQVDSHVAE